MKSIGYSEILDLPFGTNLVVHIKMDVPYKRDETYNAVIVRDKIYYEDGKVDDIRTISEYIYNGVTEVFIKA